MRPIHTLLFLASALALAACKQGGEPEAAPAEPAASTETPAADPAAPPVLDTMAMPVARNAASMLAGSVSSAARAASNPRRMPMP